QVHHPAAPHMLTTAPAVAQDVGVGAAGVLQRVGQEFSLAGLPFQKFQKRLGILARQPLRLGHRSTLPPRPLCRARAERSGRWIPPSAAPRFTLDRRTSVPDASLACILLTPARSFTPCTDPCCSFRSPRCFSPPMPKMTRSRRTKQPSRANGN